MPGGAVGTYRDGGEGDGTEDLADGFEEGFGVAWRAKGGREERICQGGLRMKGGRERFGLTGIASVEERERGGRRCRRGGRGGSEDLFEVHTGPEGGVGVDSYAT